MSSLSEMASVTSEDDVHLKAAYPDGAVVEFKIPEIYPNVFSFRWNEE